MVDVLHHQSSTFVFPIYPILYISYFSLLKENGALDKERLTLTLGFFKALFLRPGPDQEKIHKTEIFHVLSPYGLSSVWHLHFSPKSQSNKKHTEWCSSGALMGAVWCILVPYFASFFCLLENRFQAFFLQIPRPCMSLLPPPFLAPWPGSSHVLCNDGSLFQSLT